MAKVRKKLSVRAQPLIAVRDVMASTEWYSRVVGLKPQARTKDYTHGGLYNRLMDDRGLVLQLHRWEDEDHPNLVGEHTAKHGHGVLLWFEVDDFDAAVRRAKKLKAKVVQAPHVNEAPMHREIWLEDPDGYVVVVCSPDGEAG